MTRRIHGFYSQDVVASWTEPNSIGNFRDYNAPRNAPAKDPVAHLDKVAFHSRFFLYEVVIDRVVTVAHPAVAPVQSTQGYAGIMSVVWRGQMAQASRVLLPHGLPYTPLVVVAYNNAMVVAGTIVQTSTAGTRFVSVYADGTSVGLGEAAYANEVSLPAVSRSYRVVVFRTPAPDPAKPQFSGNGDEFQIGRGIIDSNKSYLRRVTAGGGSLAMDLSRTMDLENGGARIVTGGNVQTDQFYDGSFTGGGFVPVNV